jgi:hypothetical protein
MDTSERSATIGADIRPIVKTKLAEIAKTQGTSMSALVSDWLEEKLVSLGIDIAQGNDNGEGEPALPLE